MVSVPILIGIFCRWHESDNVLAIWSVACIVFAAGMAIRIWAQQYLHFKLHMKMVLTTGGPYSLVRNPIYIGNTLICMGLTMASKMLWLVPIALLTCGAVFFFVVRSEEKYLTGLYGDAYAEYTKQVPRWIPKFPGRIEKLWSPHYLGVSVRAELYNLLFLVPLIVKELLT